MDNPNSATRLVQAASHAVVLIEKFSSCQENDSAWNKDPDDIFRQLHEARQQIIIAAARADETNQTTDDASSNFRALYLEMITDAFADVLDDLRKNDNAFDVTVLVDCLQSGMDFLTTTREKELLLLPSSDDDEIMTTTTMEDSTTTSSSDMTPHEKKRRALGFQI